MTERASGEKIWLDQFTSKYLENLTLTQNLGRRTLLQCIIILLHVVGLH